MQLWKFVIGAALIVGAVYVAIAAIGLYITIVLLIIGAPPAFRFVYFFFNPDAKLRYEEKKRAEAEEKQRLEREAQREAAELERLEAELRLAKIKAKQEMRDADTQTSPYEYEIGRHANETLAIRYGIANLERKVTPYYYYAKGGERKRNPERDKVDWVPSEKILLQKVGKIGPNKYEVLLSDYRNRPAIAIIEPGKEYVKTFYPKNGEWFSKHRELEEVLKGNRSMSLKELAHFHIEKAIPSTQ